MKWLLLLFLVVGCTTPQANTEHIVEEPVTVQWGAEGVREIDIGNSHIMIKGTIADLVYEGEFLQYIGRMDYDNGALVGVSGSINADSISIGDATVNKHLRSDYFFHVEKYPTIHFTSSAIENGELQGSLRFRGITKEITIPVTVENGVIKAEFLLDVSLFGVTYPGLDSEVQVSFLLTPT